jgi:ubiquinone/menaquinone biosynthesis C-methylase UbiE
MSEAQRTFIPAAGHDWLLPFYDPIQWLLGGDAARRALVEQAELRSGQRLLDIGCGTGSLVTLIKGLRPDAEVVGLDPDPKALDRARRKAQRAGAAIKFDQGFADALPYEAASFDRVFSSFMFHHLDRPVKEGMLRETRRVLAPGGSLHLVDFGGAAPRQEGLLARWLHAHLEDNFGGGIATLMAAAGFLGVQETATRRTLFGRIAFYRATRPD